MQVQVGIRRAGVFIAGLVFISFCLVSSLSNAAITVYTDRTAWEAAHDYPVEEEFFTDEVLNPAVSVTSRWGYVDASGEKGWGAGVWYDILTEGLSTIWKFDQPVFGFGGYWNLAGPGGPGTGLLLYLDDEQYNAVEISNDLDGDFLGIISTLPFHQVRIISVPAFEQYEHYTLDNMVYAMSRVRLTKTDNFDPNETTCVSFGDPITYTLRWDNIDDVTLQNVFLTDYLPEGVSFNEIINKTSSPPGDPPVDPNVVFSITDANGLDEITLPVGQSIRLYINKETTNADIFSFYLEADISDPNFGWIDNTEYDPNDPNSSTAEILATPRETSYDYYGPGYTQDEGIQFCAVNFGDAIDDGQLASFIYTASQVGYVTLSLVNYGTPATLREIIICQTDPNDPNNIPEDPNTMAEPAAHPVTPPTGVYHEDTHTITWAIGTLNPGDYSVVDIKVHVNIKALPLSQLDNRAVITYGNESVEAIETTDVCCWDIGTIYVYDDAEGLNNGTSWKNAFTSLQDAIARANDRCSAFPGQIWVARGDYYPGDNTEDTFQIPDNESVYGGFAGWENSIDLRNIKANPTILSGYIRTDEYGNIYRNKTVVKMGDNSCLDGFIVKDSGGSPEGYGIYGKEADFTILNCVCEENQQYGLYAENCNLIVKWCTVQNNGVSGIYHTCTSTKSINVENCLISMNVQHGFYTKNSFPTICNNQIGFNGAGSTDIVVFYGLFLDDPNTSYDIRNNTVIYNVNEGICVNKTDPNIPLDIYNCILFGNKDNTDEQLEGSVAAWYSCVWDPNNIYTTPDDSNNISCDPNFAYDGDPNVVIYHLMADSPCIDKGHPSLDYSDQNDLDTEPRWMGEYVDMGADEICPDCNDVYNPYDWSADGIVNFDEFNRFSRAWLSWNPYVYDSNCPDYGYYGDPNSSGYIDPNSCIHWDYRCNLVAAGLSQYMIDLADLQTFLEDAPWLWIACWRMDIWDMLEQQEQQLMMSMGSNLMADLQSARISEQAISIPLAQEEATQSVTVEEFNPATEKAVILSLLEDIQVFIDAGGEDAEAWQEMKDILEQSLVDIEDMLNDSNET